MFDFTCPRARFRLAVLGTEPAGRLLGITDRCVFWLPATLFTPAMFNTTPTTLAESGTMSAVVGSTASTPRIGTVVNSPGPSGELTDDRCSPVRVSRIRPGVT